MKNLIYILVCLSYSFCFSQNKYKVEYEIFASEVIPMGPLEVYIFGLNLNTSNEVVPILQEIPFNFNANTTTYDEVVILNNPLDNIGLFGSAAIIDEFGSVSCANTRDDNEPFANSCFTFSGSLLSGCGTNVSINYLKVYEILDLATVNNLNVTNNQINDCEIRTIKVSDCSWTSTYSVDYSVGTQGVWYSLLPYAERMSSFQVSKNDFTNAQTNDNVNIRVSYQNSTVNSNIITYNLVRCSPLIVGIPNVQDATCSYAPLNNGDFTVTFNRPLDGTEQLTIVNLYHDGPDGVINNADDVLLDTLIDQSYTGMNYTWPYPIPADQYRLEYQSGGNTPIVFFPIIINEPTPVTFTATLANNVECFGDNTGSISITAAGGTGNYEYSINDGLIWLPFSNSTSHVATNLTANNYKVKVKDSNNCVAQQ